MPQNAGYGAETIGDEIFEAGAEVRQSLADHPEDSRVYSNGRVCSLVASALTHLSKARWPLRRERRR